MLIIEESSERQAEALKKHHIENQLRSPQRNSCHDSPFQKKLLRTTYSRDLLENEDIY